MHCTACSAPQTALNGFLSHTHIHKMHTLMCMYLQANVNEIMAVSVVYMGQVPVDRPCTSWNNSRHLRHFSVLRKMDNQPFPTGPPA